MQRSRFGAFLLSGLRWLLRWAPTIAIAVLIFAVLFYGLAVLFFDPLAKAYIGTLNQQLPLKIELGHASLSWGRVAFDKLKLIARDGRPLLNAEKGTVRWQFLHGLAHGGWNWVGDGELDKVDGYLSIDKEGKFNWGGLESKTPGQGPPAFWTQYSGKLTAHEVILNYKDERDGGFFYSVDKFTLQAEIRPGEPILLHGLSDDPTLPWGDADAKQRAVAHGKPSKAQANGRVWPLKPQLDAHLSVFNWPLEEFARHPKIATYLAVRGGVGSGQLWLRGEAETWPVLWKNMVKEIRLHVDGPRIEFPWLPEVFNNVKGELRWSAGTISTHQLTSDFLGGKAQLHGRVSTAPEGADVRLSMQAKGLDVSLLAKRLKPEFKPVAGRVDADVVAEGFVRTVSVKGTLTSKRVVLAGKEFKPMHATFDWSGGALHLAELYAGNGGGQFAADGWIFPGPLSKKGVDMKKVQLMLHLGARNANLHELLPKLDPALRVDGDVSVLGSPLNPIISGRGALRNLTYGGQTITRAQGHLLVDKGGAILFNADVNSPLGGVNLPWAFYDFRQKYAEAAVIAKDVRFAAQGAAGRVNASLTLRGQVTDPKSWRAVGQIHDGEASYQGKQVTNVQGPFLYQGGELSTAGIGADIAGGHVAVVGEYSNTSRRLKGMVQGHNISLARLGVGGGQPMTPSSADFIGSLDSQNGQAVGYGWLDSPEVSGAGLAFGTSPRDLKAMLWFDKVDPRRLGFAGIPENVAGQLAFEAQGGREKVYYSASAGRKNELNVVGEASRTGSSWMPGANYLTFPGQIVSQYSPTVLEGGAYPYHGPERGRELRPVTPIGAELGLPAQSGKELGLLSVTPKSGGNGRYNVNVDGLDLVPLSRMVGFDLNSMLRQQSGLELLSAGFSAKGSVQIQNNRLKAVDMGFDAPWLRLRSAQKDADPVTVSVYGKMRTAQDGSVRGETRLAPQPYALPGTRGELLIAGRYLEPKGRGYALAPDVRVDTHGFPLEVLRPLLPTTVASFLPSGRVDTQGFRLWGDLRRPSVAGDLALHAGRVWLHQQPVDIDEARVRLSSSGGEVRIDEMAVQAGPLRLEGEGRRDKDNRLSGLLKMHQIPLSFLDPLGRPWSDIDGQIEAQVAFRGKGLIPDEAFLSLVGSHLTYSPTGTGGVAPPPLNIQTLLLGKAPTPQEGVRFRMQTGEIIVDFPPDSVSATLLGEPPRSKNVIAGAASTGIPTAANGTNPLALNAPAPTIAPPSASAVPLPTPEKTAAGPLSGKLTLAGQLRLKGMPGGHLAQWLQGPNGPVFGNGSSPLVLGWQDLSQGLLGRYLTFTSDTQGESSGQLRLTGQVYQNHLARTEAYNPPPLAEVIVERLHLTRGQGASQQTMQLADRLRLRYQREDNQTWLRVDPFKMSMAQTTNTTVTNSTLASTTVTAGNISAGSSRGETPVPPSTNVAGELQGEAAIPLMHLESAALAPSAKGAKQRKGDKPAKVRVQAHELPLEMLGAFFPFLTYGTGTIHQLEVDAQGDLLRPNMTAMLHMGPGSIGALRFAKVDGSAEGTPGAGGAYRLNFSGPTQAAGAKPAAGIQIFLGQQVSASQRIFLDGGVNLLWKQAPAKKAYAANTLQPIWSRYSLSSDSTLEMHAELVDEQARLLTSLLPDAQAGGKLSGNLDIKGPLSQPELAGALEWNNGSLTQPMLGQPMTDIQFKARFEKITVAQAEPGSQALIASMGGAGDSFLSRYTLDRLDGLWGTKAFHGKGKAELLGIQPTFVDVALAGKDLPIKAGGYFSGRADVDLKLQGKVGPVEGSDVERLTPVLTGNVTVPEGDLSVPLSLGSSSAPNAAWNNFWKNSPFRYDVNLTLGDNVWASFFGSTVRGQGTLNILPSPATGQPVATGSIFLSRGVIHVPLYEVNFRIRQGNAVFEDDWMPTLENVEADTTLGDHQISARFDGKFPNIKAQFVSNPPLADSDVQRLVGYDGTSTTASNPLELLNQQQNQGFLQGSGVSFLSNLLTSQLTQGIGRTLFLSEVSFDYLPPNDYLLRVAKSLNDRDTILLTFSQLVSSSNRLNQSNQQYGIEWRFKPNLLTRVTIDNLGQARIWFQGLLRFQGI